MNKKINQLDNRVSPSLTDLMLIGDPASGTSYKLTAKDIAALSLPIGGTTGQILAKINATDYNLEWIDNYTSQVKHIVKAGVAVNKGEAVYISSADGTNMIVSKASNVSDALSATTIGIVAQSLSINGQGFVITEGLLTGINTSTATIGDPIWLGVDGVLIFGLANKPVAPAHLVYLGTVTRVHAVNGEIFIKVSNGWEMAELHDALIVTPSTGQLLRYDSDGLWKNWTSNYLTTETDPVWTAEKANYLTTANAALTYQPILTGTGIVKSTAGTISYLTDNSTNWNSAYSFTSAFPSQTGNSGKYLTTNGTSLSWATVAGGTDFYTTDGTLTSNRTVTLSTFSLTFAGTTSSRFFANGNVGVGIITDAGYKLDVNGTARLNNSVIAQTVSTVNVLDIGNIRIADDGNGRYFQATNGIEFRASNATANVMRVSSAATNVWATSQAISFRPNSTVNNGIYLTAVNAAPSSTTITISRQRNDGTKSGIINTEDFAVSGSTPVDLYIYAGKETVLNNQANMFLAWDGSSARGNINIGGSSNDASALVNIQSTTKGFLPPRMTTTQKNAISTPANGLVVFDTTLNKLCVYTTAWETITSI